MKRTKMPNKKYVLIVPSVSDMGGAQMYIRNKVLYLRQNQWYVDVVVAQGGRVQISELQEFQFAIPELAFNIYCYSNKKKKQIVDKIVEKIKDDTAEEFVIESTCISESSWAEAVAKRLGAKHISFLLQEGNVVTNVGMQQFFIFKHHRRELAGIVDTSLITMFAPFHPIPKEDSYKLLAYCNNVEADIDSPYIRQVDAIDCDYVVGMLSRLEKPFVMPAIIDFCQYAQIHRDKKFLLLLMGSAPKGSGVLEKLQLLIKARTSNISVISTGYLYPVPTKLLEKCDAFFTSAGSSQVCMYSGVPTIAYDGNDFKPIGIMGRTTMNSLFRGENEPPQDFSILMDQILIEQKYKKEATTYEKGLPDFTDFLQFLSVTSKEKDYYDVESIRPESNVDYKLKCGLAFIGPKNYLKLGFLKKKWKM